MIAVTTNLKGIAKGAHHSFKKFDPGFAAALHHHSADRFVTVVAGTMILTVDGQEHRLPPGSYFAMKQKQAHLTSCAPGADALFSPMLVENGMLFRRRNK